MHSGDFNEWLDCKLKEKTNFDFYDPNGNSPRAVVSRMKSGYIKSLTWECKEIAKDVKYIFTDAWEGFDTPISWFVQVLTLPILILIAPFARTYSRHKRAIGEYVEMFNNQK